MRVVCPICKSELTGSAERLEYHPFCSRRCKQIDLGNWLTERYRISEPLQPDEFDAPEPGARRPPN